MNKGALCHLVNGASDVHANILMDVIDNVYIFTKLSRAKLHVFNT